MSEYRKLASNVNTFYRDACVSYGKIKENEFSQRIFCQLIEGEIKSPIEDLFFIACNVLAAAHSVEIDPFVWSETSKSVVSGSGIFIQPQFVIGKYRVDFLITQNGIGLDEFLSPVVVELDGHDFHDKDKTQRAYEKARDRFIVKAGYKVLHFTGSEVVADPYKVAFEALCMVGMNAVSGVSVYDPSNPFGIE